MPCLDFCLRRSFVRYQPALPCPCVFLLFFVFAVPTTQWKKFLYVIVGAAHEFGGSWDVAAEFVFLFHKKMVC